MFSKMPHVLRKDELLDRAFSRARNVKKTIDKRDRINSIRQYEENKINTVTLTINSALENILVNTPDISRLDPFYMNLASISVDMGQFKKSLAALKWATVFNRELERKYRRSIKGSPLKSLSSVRKEFYGRISSVMKQVGDDLVFLEDSRNILKKLPLLKDLPTVVLAGYPNVGKSSLLKSLTGAEPEIQAYPFTTKKILLGYIDEKIQVIDTPGLLDRPAEKKSPIEMQAITALRYKADLILFLIDPTESCGYSLESQQSLCSGIKETFPGTPVLVCMTKSDLKKENKCNIYLSSKTGYGIPELRKLLLRSVDWNTKKFRIRSVNN